VPLWTRNFTVVVLLNFLLFGGMWMLPSLLPVYIRDLGAPDYMLGWVTALTSVATIIARPLAGVAVDRYGRRGVFTVGVIGMVVTAVTFAFIPIVAAIMAVRFIQGLAWGTANTACATIATDTVPKPRYAEGIGFFSQGSSVALIIAPAISLTVFYQVGGQLSVLICAGFFTLALIASCFITYQSVDKRPPTAPKPQRSAWQFIQNTLLERSALLAGAMMFFTACSYGVVQTFLPTMLELRGVEGIAWFFVVSAIVALIGRPLFGRWVDAKGYTAPVVTGFITLAIGMAVLCFTTSLPMLLLGAVFQGIGYSTCFSMFMALASKDAPPKRRGSAIATAMICFDVGAGFTALAFGFAIAGFGYGAAFLGAAVLALIAIVVYLLCVRARATS
jgi:MFS family permease